MIHDHGGVIAWFTRQLTDQVFSSAGVRVFSRIRRTISTDQIELLCCVLKLQLAPAVCKVLVTSVMHHMIWVQIAPMVVLLASN
jgi:hypothetical protein